VRALSERQASTCEQAKHPRCACRCGGALHGAARTVAPKELPLDDPHCALTARERQAEESLGKPPRENEGRRR